MLADLRIKHAKPSKIADGGGLFLFVSLSGGKRWRFRYTFGGKEKLPSLGPYPDITLLAARTERDQAKAMLRAGKDPSITKKLRKLAGMNAPTTSTSLLVRLKSAPLISLRHRSATA